LWSISQKKEKTVEANAEVVLAVAKAVAVTKAVETAGLTKP
jgi:hypothetical protein